MIGGRGGVCQIMTVDDRGEEGLAYLVRPDDVISGQPPMSLTITSTIHILCSLSKKTARCSICYYYVHIPTIFPILSASCVSGSHSATGILAEVR